MILSALKLFKPLRLSNLAERPRTLSLVIVPLLLIVVELIFVAFTARLRVESLVIVPALLIVVELTVVLFVVAEVIVPTFPARLFSESARNVC